MLELYQHESSADCAVVRRKLEELGLDWVSRTVPPSPEERQRVIEITGRPEVPVLIDPEHGMAITEAEDICAYLEETYPPPATD